MLVEAHFARDVEGATDADGRIHQDAAPVVERIARLALQQVVHTDHQIGDVAEEIADHCLDRQRGHIVVTLGNRLRDGRIKHLVDREHRTVPALGRIVRVVTSDSRPERQAATVSEAPT